MNARPPNVTTSDSSTLFQRLSQLTDQQLTDPAFSLDQLAQQIGLSRSSMNRLVKQQTGLSPSHFVRQRRLLMARHLLETTDARVTEIADQVGFGTSQELSRYFADTFGSSPSEFRKQLSISPGEDAAVSSVPSVVPPTPSKVSNRQKWGLVAVGLLIILGLGAWLYRYRWPSMEDAPVALAVLPFEHLGPDSSAYYSEGISESLHELLMNVDGLNLISQTATRPYTRLRQPLSQIAHELGARYLLMGRIRLEANRVQVMVELVLASQNRTLWSHRYTGSPKEAMGFMDQIARQVTSQLLQSLYSSHQLTAKVPTQNPAAYNAYLKGQFLLRTRTEPELVASLLEFTRAIELDSLFADAYASRAQTYYLFAEEEYRPSVPNLQKAETNALTAIRLDAENGMAYATLANIYRARNQWEQALTAYQIALRFRPNDALINYWYSISLRSIGKLDEAIRYSTKAIELDPVHPVILIGHIGNLSYAHRFKEAQAAIAEGQQLHHQVPSWYWATGFYFINRKEYALALAEFTKCYRLNPAVRSYRAMMAYCQSQIGQQSAAKACLDSLPTTPEQLPNRAIVLAGLGESEACLQTLEQGARVGELPNYLKVSPLFVQFRANPRFQAVLRQVGL
ncbi:helix-turn-helix domain-containing protein [Spirosoma gilvum]